MKSVVNILLPGLMALAIICGGVPSPEVQAKTPTQLVGVWKTEVLNPIFEPILGTHWFKADGTFEASATTVINGVDMTFRCGGRYSYANGMFIYSNLGRDALSISWINADQFIATVVKSESDPEFIGMRIRFIRVG